MEFKKYQHLERLGTSEVQGIEVGLCYIFPKLDGANGSIWFEDGKVMCGSRNRVLSLENDNAGFCQWVTNNEEKFQHLFTLYPNFILYGEWLVPHTIRDYRDDVWRNFYVFDFYNKVEHTYYNYDTYKIILEAFKINFVLLQKKISNPTYENLLHESENTSFLLKDGAKGEGIVIKNYSYTSPYGRIIWAKLIRNDFKEKHSKVMGVGEIVNIPIEQKIVDEFVTIHLCQKVFAKICNETIWNSRLIPQLLNTVYYDLIKEESWEFVKKYKNPTINYKTLQTLTFYKVKSLMNIF